MKKQEKICKNTLNDIFSISFRINVYSPIFSNENHHFCFTLRRRSTNLCIFYFYQKSSQAAFCLFIIFSPCVVIGLLWSWDIDQLPSTNLGCLLQWPNDDTRSCDRGWRNLSRFLIKKKYERHKFDFIQNKA